LRQFDEGIHLLFPQRGAEKSAIQKTVTHSERGIIDAVASPRYHHLLIELMGTHKNLSLNDNDNLLFAFTKNAAATSPTTLVSQWKVPNLQTAIYRL
jgi:hypothetical protein